VSKCGWCFHEPKAGLSGFEKKALSGEWKEMCRRCLSYYRRVQRTNPFAGLLPEVRPVGTGPTGE
jgi:hypothetical protein